MTTPIAELTVAAAGAAVIEAARALESTFAYHGYSPQVTACLYGLREAVIALDAAELEAAIIAVRGSKLPFA